MRMDPRLLITVTVNFLPRSAITIFPARKHDVRTDFRVWNAQLISYAGYVDPEDPNHIIGDPLNVEFTQVCSFPLFSHFLLSSTEVLPRLFLSRVLSLPLTLHEFPILSLFPLKLFLSLFPLKLFLSNLRHA